MRILVIEDEPSMLKGLLDVLTVKGYDAQSAIRGDEGLAQIRAGTYQLILLDGMLPGLSGFEVLKAMRADGNRTPVIMLTARNTEMDKVLGFELGVDDYITKPFSVMELLGRIQAVLRRAAPAEPTHTSSNEIRFADVVVDQKAYSLQRAGQAVELPAKCFELLRVLYAKRGQVVSRDTLIDEVWGADEFINQRTVNNLVVKLRQAIEIDPETPRHLKTIHGVGYRLDA
jgi:DNA-binding response OmpR family regulator